MENTIRNILVPVDFTEYSLHAIEIATQIAEKNNSIITLIHVLDFSVGNCIDGKEEDGLSIHDVVEKYLNLLNQVKNNIVRKHNVEIRILLERGLVVNFILEKAKKINADLMVIGTHGTEPKNFFLGINAFHIIKQTPCSVLTIPKERINGTITKIVFPGKIIHGMAEKCTFLESIVQDNDIVIEISGLNSGVDFNISVLNETIGYLENKFVEGHVQSIGELKNFVNVISESLQDLNIELMSIDVENHSKNVPVLSIVHV